MPEPITRADAGGPAAPADGASAGGPARIVALGAAGEQELRDLAAHYRAALARPGGPAADPLLRGAERAALPYRLAVVGAASGGLAEQLAAPTAIGVVPGGVRPTVAFLFTGQGSQYQRMAEVLYRTQPIFRRHLDRCDEILRPHLDRPLLELLYPADGRTRPLDQTIYTQPLTFAVDYALAQLWRAWGVEPDAVLGHSVGEYAAACVAGVFDLDEGLLLIARRARLMQELPAGGGMLAVRADEATVRSHLRAGSGIAVAALNGPTSVVLAGDERQLDAVAASLRQAGVTAVRLGVSHAFHSALMEPVLAPFEECFRHVTLRPPRIPLISNLTGRPAGAEIADPEYWLRQLRQPVRFADGVRWLAADGIAAFLEVGPGTTLAGLARESLGTLGDGRASGAAPLVVSSLARGRDDVEVILAALGQLWVRGAPVAWDAVDGAAAVARGRDGTGGDVAAAPRATANGAGQASSPGGAAPGGAAAVDAAPSTAAPAPTTLFNAEIDHASVSRTLAELRQGRLSMTEALAAIRRGNGSGPSADPAPADGPLSDGAA